LCYQALGWCDRAVIRLCCNLSTRNVSILLKRIDELPEPERQGGESRDSIRATLKAQKGPEECEIIFGSAYWANKVLADDIENMAEDSAEALLNWAAENPSATEQDGTPATMVWGLSGIPALYHAIGTRVAEGQGRALLSKTARAAMNLAQSLTVSEVITVTAQGDAPRNVNPDHIARTLDAIAHKHVSALQSQLASVTKSYHARSDRAHGNFLDRATHSLIKHLEQFGESPTWSYDPTGLRMLLRSAYTVFGTQVRGDAKRVYEAAATDIAHVYAQSFGGVVNGFAIEAPTPPEIVPPVGLGQTIALDFKDGWWASWWRRTRGYKAFAESFRAMIKGETDSILAELKFTQADALQAATVQTLSAFLGEQKELLLDLSQKASEGADALDAALSADDHARRRAHLDRAMQSLSACAA